MKKILVIEDNPKHLQDVKDFFSTVEGVEVTYQRSYKPFTSITRTNTPSWGDDFRKYDGVISDIYFPDGTYDGNIQPVGVSVMFQCKMMNIPCVLCTDGYHHGENYQWINDMWVALRGDAGWKNIPQIIDYAYSVQGDDSLELEEEGPRGERVTTKAWSEAWKELRKFLPQ